MNIPIQSQHGPETPARDSGAKLTIPVLREFAEIETVLEQTGTVRVRKVVHREQQLVPAQGYREVVETERRHVNQQVEAVRAPRHEADVLIIPVYEERTVKQLFLLEEIYVRRRREATADSEVIELRREEIVVERLDPATQKWLIDPGR
jgi:stress response protein YsnF